MAVSKRTRYEVLRRDNHTCRYCHATDSPLTVDHVTPVALGGTDAPDNLVAACKDCNAGKSSSSPSAELLADVSNDAVRWAQAIAEAGQILAVQGGAERSYLNEFAKSWSKWFPSNWEASLRSLYRAGLPLSEMLDAADIAQATRGLDDRFRYFCGICWKKVERLQQIARDLVAD